MEGILTSIIDKNIAAFQTAEALETALVNQKGFVSYYFMDGNPDWLRQLGKYRQIFKERLNEAYSFVENKQQKEVINQIKFEYEFYITSKDRVIVHYKAGERDAGAKLHQEVRKHFFKILDLCEEYKSIHTKRIMQTREESHAQAIKLRIITGTTILIVFFLVMLLTFVLANQIWDPLRKLALETNQKGSIKKSENEVKALSRSVHELIEDADQTHIELERSRKHLLQAEKMALVGKLAAGIAHSIRNPFTSVKMRLFSLNRSLKLSASQKEDFEVISDEIRHIDNIIQNFLEFSRPPKLKMQHVSPSVVVDLVVQLLEHRLNSYDVKIKVVRKKPLPEIQVDPEQLKEVLVNLVVNACESVDTGSTIVIQEEEAFENSLGKVVIIRLTDNGPGISESIIEKIFQPFFTTKEDGSGLGLSIASRIIEEHGGQIDVTSKEGEGAAFIITLPLKESNLEQNPNH
jgi:signal transduction histidine kinase